MSDFLPPWLDLRLSIILASAAVYLSLCHTLRFQRVRRLQRKYGFGTLSRPFSDMTNQEAFEIQTEISVSEFPSLFEKGLQLALFRTYGIPTISKLLVETAQLSTRGNVAKRYADTAVLLVEIYDSAPKDERGIEALARLNYLHGHYRKQGRITNDDLLYTLALFMNHPCDWINKYEWRKLTDVEICAVAVFHKSWGEAMEISYDVLPSSKTGWKDGLHFYQELDRWATEYEEKYMKPHKDNYNIAIKTQELLFSTIPSFTHGAISQVLAAVMDDRLREAIMFNAPAPIAKWCWNSLMTVRRFILRHCALPRFSRQYTLSRNSSPDGHRWVEIWSTTPHYVKSTLWSRWGPSGIYQLLLGQPRPGDPGMYPEGYLRSNIGPKAFNGKGRDVFEEEKRRLTHFRTGACPFKLTK